MDKLVANRYAKALFDIAYEKNAVEHYYNQINTINQIINENKEFIDIVVHPDISLGEKMVVISNALKGKVEDDILGFLNVILRKNREQNMLEIFQAFIEMVDIFNKKVLAIVSSAVELSESQIYDIKTKLAQKLNKQVEIKTEIDKDLIAGLKITVDNRIIDASVKYQFQMMKKQLLQMQPV